VRAASNRMIPAACLLARHEGFSLIDGDQGLPFKRRLFVDLLDLLTLLLGRKGRVGTNSFDLRTCLASDRACLFHHGSFDSSLLPAGLASMVSILALSWRS